MTDDNYTPNWRLRDMLEDNKLLLLVISRFSIPFGFGNKTVAEVCRDNNIHCPTFLSVANLISGHKYDSSNISLQQLTGYLKKAHTYFLDFALPMIRRRMVEALCGSELDDVAFLILKYFDNYAVEVHKHMEFENTRLFSYVDSLLAGNPDKDFDLHHYTTHHSDLTERLNELNNIIIRHYRRNDSDMLNAVLYDIFACQNDLMSHCDVENRILVPAIRHLLSTHTAVAPSPVAEAVKSAESDNPLSQREKEIIALVSKGLANKEIADRLCLSVNTVTTHRRNIASKLQIHSAAGLTIYAIMHKLIDISEIHLE